MKREAGHTFLARLGKKRLRPGGKIATNWLKEKANLSSETNVLEVACNMGTTAIELASTYGCKITGVDLDKKALEQAKANIKEHKLEHLVTVVQANATKLPFPDNSFDVVINEAMLTMLPSKVKAMAVAEYYRVLKPGGKLLTHDVMLAVPNRDAVENMHEAINVKAEPLVREAWEELFRNGQFSEVESISGPMSLLSPSGLIRDEGVLGTAKIVRNAMKKENRETFLKMFRSFKGRKNVMRFIAVCSSKK